MSADDNKVYAKVENGVIVQYPVLPIHILNNGTPLEWFTEVERDTLPEIPDFYWLQESLKVLTPLNQPVRVVASYTLVAYTLSQILDSLQKPSEMPGMPSGIPMDIADVPLETVNRVAQLATNYAKDRLDAFVHERNYDSIATAVTYRDSAVPQFAHEANLAFGYRDQTYAALYQYLGKVQAAQVPVPIAVSDIEAILPVLSWE